MQENNAKMTKQNNTTTDLTVLSSHALQPRQSKVRRILVTFSNAIHQVNEHFRVFLKLLHLNCIGEDHVQIKHQVSHLHRQV